MTQPPVTLSLWQEGECFLLGFAGRAQTPEFGQTMFPNGTEECVFSALLPWTGYNSPDLNIFKCPAKKKKKKNRFPNSSKVNLNFCAGEEPTDYDPEHP